MRPAWSRLLSWTRLRWSVMREVRQGHRCNRCHERYAGLAQDCACTNWGGFIG